MINEYLDLFGDLIFNPLVFLGILVGFFFIISQKGSIKTRWVILALLALVASFAEFRNEFVADPPDLAFPLESIRAYGRPIAIIFLLSLLIFALWFRLGTQKLRDQLVIQRALLAIQLLIFAKNIFQGDTLQALLAFLTFFLVYYLFHSGVTRWVYSDKVFRYGVGCFVGVIVLFNLMGFYQSLIDFWPMTFQQNRYMGMTGNPQHAAVLLATGTPLFMFWIIQAKIPHIRLGLILLLLWSFYYLILTGSRTGVLLALISLSVYIAGYRASTLKYLIPIMIVLFVVSYINIDLSGNVDQNTLNRYTDPTNTRSRVISSQITQFLNYPVFGAPLRGDRLAFGENSYGAIAASLGAMGLIPLFIMIRGLLVLSRKLWRISKQSKEDKHYHLMVVAGIIAMLVGAFLEAYLVGNLTWPLIMLLTYVAWGYYLLERAKKRVVVGSTFSREPVMESL